MSRKTTPRVSARREMVYEWLSECLDAGLADTIGRLTDINISAEPLYEATCDED